MAYLCGQHAVSALLNNSAMVIHRLMIERSKSKHYQQQIKQAKHLGCTVDMIADMSKQFKGNRHQGIAAEFTFSWANPSVLADNPNALVLILDRLQDPHNFGACLRSAAAFGVDAVVVPERGSSPMTEVVHQVSSGGSLTVPIVKVGNLKQAMSEMRDLGYWFMATDEHATDHMTNIDVSGRLALVMGSEGEGVRQGVVDACDYKVSIPTSSRLSTLNVSVATGVLLSQLFIMKSSK